MVRQLRLWRRQNRWWRSYRVVLLLLRTLFVINRERSRVLRAHARGDTDVRPDIGALVRVLREFRKAAIEMGGLLIKLGQFLGARADLLPEEALAELAQLHDAVPAEPFVDILAVLEREWGSPWREVCRDINPEPAGSASLGQVHQAELLDGRMVALKVQRPGIRGIIRSDLWSFRFVLRIVKRVAPLANQITDLNQLYRELSRTVYEELDYMQEGRNAERFAKLFEEDPLILVPGIIHTYSTQQVLVLEWMDGIPITDYDKLDVAGVDREQVARVLLGAYFTQILQAGYFHADPHPGNLLIQPHPGADRLIFVDFGMMGQVTARMRTGLQEMVRGILAQDSTRLLNGLDKLGFLSPAADRATLEPVLAEMLARFPLTGNLEEAAAQSYGSRRGGWEPPREVMQDVGHTLYDMPFRLPAQFAFFGRMIGILFGVTRGLAPDLNFLEASMPYARQFMGNNEERGGFDAILSLLGIDSTADLGRILLRDGVATLQSLVALPRRVDRLLDRAERGELHLVVRTDDARDRNQSSGVLKTLNRPTPLWVPLGVLGASAALILTRAAWPLRRKRR